MAEDQVSNDFSSGARGSEWGLTWVDVNITDEEFNFKIMFRQTVL